MVLTGQIVAGPYVRLACQRHLDDLESAAERGIWFDENDAEVAIEFFECFLVLEDGRPFMLESWQKFIIGSLYGWKTTNGWRRFRVAYIEVGKGNGKTPMAAGMALYAISVESIYEPGVEVYMAATTRDQAGIGHRDAKMMVENSPALRDRLDANFFTVSNPSTNSYIKPVSREHKGLDGKRVHLGILDELHEHPNALIVQKMRAGVKGRRNALIIEITNSGFDTSSICFQHHDMGIKVLEGAVDNDSWFVYICALDKDDDWRDESVWIKANPNLGISIHYDYLREQVEEARAIPSSTNMVKRLNFCIWTEAATRWLSQEAWDSCVGPVPWQQMRAMYAGSEADLGVDLSSTTDMTAVVLLIPEEGEEDEVYNVIPFFWVPEATAFENGKRGGPYSGWIEAGALRSTDGNVIDYDEIEREVLEIADQFSLREIAYDPWNATQFSLKLANAGLEMIPVRQGFPSLNEATKKIEELVTSGKLRHGGHPVLRWMALNTMVVSDPAGNKKPAKDKSVGKIDGMSALVTVMSRSMLTEEYDSPYEGKDMAVL